MSDVTWATTGFVPGLKLRLTAVELADHMRKRAAYHAGRKADKERHLPELVDAKKQIEEATEKIKAVQPAPNVHAFNKGGPSNRSTYGFDGEGAAEGLDRQIEQLKSDIDTHHNKSLAFAFLADHLFPQDYCLDRNDLVSLEILKCRDSPAGGRPAGWATAH